MSLIIIPLEDKLMNIFFHLTICALSWTDLVLLQRKSTHAHKIKHTQTHIRTNHISSFLPKQMHLVGDAKQCFTQLNI